ncbi:CAP domain-containing protein [Streptosporangium sp. NPDC087985]|uniref:CAP domain-containing protein n=1 Tax=Streptosporangium sp. NPDC087985 TaxID=3366196 RepID=UPI003827133E
MGLFACMMTVLLLGFLIGRESRGEETPDQIYLNNAGPVKPTPTGQRAPLARVVRPSPAPVTTRQQFPPRVPRDSRTPAGEFTDDDEAHYILNGERGGGEGGTSVFSPLTSMERRIIQLTNVQRRKYGCAPLRIDRRLIRSARAHSEEMGQSGTFSHSSPDGASPWDRMEAAGYRDGGAENISRGYASAAETVRRWMATSSHRGNILNCRLTATGVGIMEGPGGPWWTQDFGYS